MDENNTEIFSTRDLYLASTLVTMHFQLLGIDYQQEGVKSKMIGYFKFKDDVNLRNAKNDYNMGRLTVEPRMFVNAMQALKAEVMSFMNNPNSSLDK